MNKDVPVHVLMEYTTSVVKAHDLSMRRSKLLENQGFGPVSILLNTVVASTFFAFSGSSGPLKNCSQSAVYTSNQVNHLHRNILAMCS